MMYLRLARVPQRLDHDLAQHVGLGESFRADIDLLRAAQARQEAEQQPGLHGRGARGHMRCARTNVVTVESAGFSRSSSKAPRWITLPSFITRISWAR